MLAFIVVAIIAVVSVANPKFIAVRGLMAISQQISVIGIPTMTMSMLLISEDIDLSVGNIMVLPGIVMTQIINTDRDIPLAAAARVGTTVACGVLNGFVIAKSECVSLIIALGTSQVFYGLAPTMSGGRTMSFEGAFSVIRKTELFNVFPVMLFVLAAMVILSYFLMNKTKFGRRIVAIGGNEKNAFLSGINIIRYRIIIYAIAGFFCVITAMTFSVRIDSITAGAETGHGTDVLAATVVGGVTSDGGKGTVPGAFLSCMFTGIISNVMDIFQVETYIQTTITGAIIVCTAALSSTSSIKKK